MAYVELYGTVQITVNVNSSSILDFTILAWGDGLSNYAETSHDRVVSLSAGDTITATFAGAITSYDSTVFRLTLEYLGEDPDA